MPTIRVLDKVGASAKFRYSHLGGSAYSVYITSRPDEVDVLFRECLCTETCSFQDNHPFQLASPVSRIHDKLTSESVLSVAFASMIVALASDTASSAFRLTLRATSTFATPQ